MKAITLLFAIQLTILFSCQNASNTTQKSTPEDYIGKWKTIDYKGWKKGDHKSSTIHQTNTNEIVWTVNGSSKSQSLIISGDTAVSNKKVNLTNRNNALLTAKNDTLFGYIATYSEELGTYHDTYVMVRMH